MPKLTVTVNHDLGAEEAIRRIKEKQETMITGGETEATDIEINWNGNEMEFQFKTFGAKINGMMVVTDNDVTVTLALPMLAMAFKGQISSRVENELQDLLR